MAQPGPRPGPGPGDLGPWGPGRGVCAHCDTGFSRLNPVIYSPTASSGARRHVLRAIEVGEALECSGGVRTARRAHTHPRRAKRRARTTFARMRVTGRC